MKYLTLLLISGLLGCSSLPEPVPSVYVELKPSTSREIQRKINQEKAIYLELGVIPGALYGNPLIAPLWYIDLNPDTGPAIDIANFQLDLKAFAEPVNTNERYNNLLVQPVDTEIARVSTIGIDVEAEKSLAGGLKNNKNEFLMLVYFSGACTISGDIDFGDEQIYSHDIEIPRAGLYRLVFEKSDNKTTVRAYESLKPLYVDLQ